jgi:endonuclease/exonuclease/phosphatase family metal-dependent hydrolase
MKILRILIWVGMAVFAIQCNWESEKGSAKNMAADSLKIRVATFNIEDIRTEDLKNPSHPRLRRIAATIQKIRPDIILINEIAYDQPGAPGFAEGDLGGQNGRRLADNFLSIPQAENLSPLEFKAFMAPSNTGLHSGFDLNNDGNKRKNFPLPPGAEPDGAAGRQTPEGREYGNDSWGFGTFPGQYAMALLMNPRFEIREDQVRTFRKFPWSAMPGALLPIDPVRQEPWYSAEEAAQFPLSSKSHWDVPLTLPNGTVLHLLCSHPTPPAFDGEEQRNKKRNHDEIRFWADYLNDADYIVDDKGKTGGYHSQNPFVILGDLNADPTGGGSLDNPIQKFLLDHPRIEGTFIPRAASMEGADADNTSGWGMRVDYVLPSQELKIADGGVWRYQQDTERYPLSDHFPVWLDIMVAEK